MTVFEVLAAGGRRSLVSAEDIAASAKLTPQMHAIAFM